MPRYLVLLCVALIAGCATDPPRTTADVCTIFHEEGGWFDAANAAYHRWGAPIGLQMAIIDQESRFVGDARPPRHHLFWIIPWTYVSSAYGYTQALTSTWNHYKRATGNGGADRDDFADATDFVGWYIEQSYRQLGLSKADAYSQYLAYYLGQAGYARGLYRGKPGLRRTARAVAVRAYRYARQLASCRDELAHPHHWWWPF